MSTIYRKMPVPKSVAHDSQRARKTEWERNKIAADQDYRLNRKDSQNKWRDKNPGYCAEYRSTHLNYCEQNRRQQKLRDVKRKARRLAKMDALAQINNIKTGSYYLIPIFADLAKMDASMQKIFIIPDGYMKSPQSCKEGLDGFQGGG